VDPIARPAVPTGPHHSHQVEGVLLFVHAHPDDPPGHHHHGFALVLSIETPAQFLAHDGTRLRGEVTPLEELGAVLRAPCLEPADGSIADERKP
jgi:hypothetical protein